MEIKAAHCEPSKNVLAPVQATVHLSPDTPDGLKQGLRCPLGKKSTEV
jgi:hypothetical protein